jgi:hypothetical protein
MRVSLFVIPAEAGIAGDEAMFVPTAASAGATVSL